jgi:hypothetical protein
MGSSFIVVGAVALGTGLVSLICGYLWGRSNVRSQIEDALDKARISADAREFSVREELDDRILELAELRARAEEIPRLRAQLEQLTLERERGFASGRSAAYAPLQQQPPEKPQQPVPAPESTDKTIQKLLKSLEERMMQTEDDPPAAIQESAKPPAKRFAVEIPPAVTQLTAKLAPAELPVAKPAPAESRAAKLAPKESRAAKPAPAAKDEWQEFAASLDALRKHQK